MENLLGNIIGTICLIIMGYVVYGQYQEQMVKYRRRKKRDTTIKSVLTKNK